MTNARDAIVVGYTAFEQAYSAGDVATISEMYTADAELLVPEAPPIKGRDAIAKVWQMIVGTGGNTIRVNTAEVQESGEWAYEVGAFIANAPNGDVLNSGKYIVIWKREPTGGWKIHRDIFNWDIPPAHAGS